MNAQQALSDAENIEQLLQGFLAKTTRKSNGFEKNSKEDTAKALCGDKRAKGSLDAAKAPVSSANSLFGLRCASIDAAKPKRRRR